MASSPPRAARRRLALLALPTVPLGVLAALGVLGACGRGLPGRATSGDGGMVVVDAGRIPYDGPPPVDAGPRTPVHAEFVSTRVDTFGLLFAAGEMQTSGEPFVQNFAGRALPYYDRYYIPVDQYLVPVSGQGQFFQAYSDPFGFSAAVEVYEYSKYHVNMISHQAGAGVSMVNGPLVAARAGATGEDKLRGRVEALLYAAGTDAAGYAHIDDAGAPTGGAYNDFGFPGLWPSLAPYRSFDASMKPETTVAHSCTSATGYGGVIFFGSNPVYSYECDYNSLRLSQRSAQIEPVTSPGLVGLAAWKYALWGIDFTGRLHDSTANGVTVVAPADMTRVGTRGNLVQAVEPPTASPGVFVGSTPLEGMWGLLMVDEADNAADWLLRSLGTSDGQTLGGFPSVAQAIQYDYGSPLVWYPTAIAVTEGGGTYPAATALSIQDATSHAADLAALAQGYSLLFGMTDARNVAVGQQIGETILFAGSIFPADDGQPDGEDTPHDRALGVMRTAFVDLDRLHVDPQTQIVLDQATVTSGGGIARGTTVTATSLGHVVIGLRHLLMGCNAAVSQYGAPDPDPSKDALGILNSVAIHPPTGEAPTFSARVRQVLKKQAVFVRDVLTRADGTVANGATLANGTFTPSTDATTLESQAAALRVLVEAWLLTQDATYQARARAVARVLLTTFWSGPAQMFRQTAGGADDVQMTAERFGWLLQALREIYEAAWVPGDPLLDRGVLERYFTRTNKLYLNGWDDLNGDAVVQKPAECLGARLQMGEQALTGEVATQQNGMSTSAGADREQDCVENIAFTGTGSLLAGQVRFHAP